MSTVYTGSATWNPSLIGTGNEESQDITVTGAVVGDIVQVSFSLDLEDLELTATVALANTVTCVLSNRTTGTITLSSGTCRVRVTSLSGLHVT